MSRNIFRLAGLLQLTRQQEQRAAARCAQARARLDAGLATRKRLEDEVAEGRRRVRDLEECTAAALQDANTRIKDDLLRIHEQDAEVVRLRRELEEEIARWQMASRYVKGLEVLAERHRQELRKRWRRYDRTQTEEVAAGQAREALERD